MSVLLSTCFTWGAPSRMVSLWIPWLLDSQLHSVECVGKAPGACSGGSIIVL